jgi:hypothetical protein
LNVTTVSGAKRRMFQFFVVLIPGSQYILICQIAT